MPLTRRQRRPLLWLFASAALLLTPLIFKLLPTSDLRIVALWHLAWLTLFLGLLSSARRVTIPNLPSELIVLGGFLALHWFMFGAILIPGALASIIAVVNHGASARVTARTPRNMLGRYNIEPAFNLWPLAPLLWHPALWTCNTPLSFLGRSAWTAAALWIASGVAARLVMGHNSAMRYLGWAAWLGVAVVTLLRLK